MPRDVDARGGARAPVDPAEGILRAALELFAGKGFQGTTTKELARAVGLKQPSLFHYFPHKDAILGELLERLVAQSLIQARGLAHLELPPAAKLWLLAFLDCSSLCADGYRGMRVMLLPSTRTPQHSSFWTKRDELREHYRRLVAATVREAREVLDDGEIHLRTSVVFGLIEAPVTWYDLAADSAALVPEATADAVLAYLLEDRTAREAATCLAQEVRTSGRFDIQPFAVAPRAASAARAGDEPARLARLEVS